MEEDEALLDVGIHTPTTKKRRRLVNDTSILWLGILSIPMNVFIGVIGLILAVRSIDRAKQALADYKKDPDLYLESSLRKVKIGRICARIGLIVFGCLVIAIVLYAR
jgi:hypothetical protein